MLDQIFSLTQRQDETSIHFLARVAIRIFSVAGCLALFAYITIVFLLPVLTKLPFPTAQFFAGFLVIFSLLSAGVATLGGFLILIQTAWRIAEVCHPLINIFTGIMQIILLLALGSLPAYLFIRGLVLSEINHLSHRINEIYRIDEEPTGYVVHLSLHLAVAIMIYWGAYKLAKNLLRQYRALTLNSNRDSK